MTIAESISAPLVGDYDVIISVIAVSEKGVTENISAQLPASRPGTTSPANATVTKAHEAATWTRRRTCCTEPTLSRFSQKGSLKRFRRTKILYSQDAFHAIKSGNGVDLTFARGLGPSTLSAAPNDIWSTLQKYTCHDTRLEAGDAAFPVLLNGKPVTLSAVRESCPHPGASGVGYVLDDDKMAIFLAATNGQVTQINYPPAMPGAGGQSIEQALKKEGHVDVYGIYFDFASDKLRPESTPGPGGDCLPP